MKTINLPSIKSLILEHFSLYQDTVTIDLSKSVSCLLGANGIGKSTLLNCINFSITGRINTPDRKLKSIEELTAGNNYYLNYFDGRISEIDKEFAAVTILFYLDEHLIEVKRRFFPDGGILSYKVDNEDRDPAMYTSDIVDYSKLKTFSQFVFLQLKILTFDESRDCLFWNSSVLTPTIFLCLGKDVEKANMADELAREILKISSRIRNVQWEITKQWSRLNTLIDEQKKLSDGSSQYSKEDEANAQNRYEELCSSIEKETAEYEGFVEERHLVYAKSTELTMKKIALENEYKTIYQKLFSANHSVKHNPIIAELTIKGCPICHKRYDQLPTKIEDEIKNNICPICGESLGSDSNDSEISIKELQKKDEEIVAVSKELQERILRQSFLDETIEKLLRSIKVLEKEKTDIEERKYTFLLASKTDDSWNERIVALKESIAGVEKEKETHIKKRDELKTQYDKICSELESVYQTVQFDFLPIFKKYAKSFTGLDLDMELNSISEDSRRLFRFILQIDDTNRDNEFELSESQRFFIDIALRMALVSFCADQTNSSMLIDTPEGSLDIAYETNAGVMFYEYISSSQKLIITANLNSSGLTQTLANMSKGGKFSLISMLKWAKLSNVQNEHMDLFEKSIEVINQKLEG